MLSLFIITSLSIEVQPDFRHTPRDKNPTENTDCTQKHFEPFRYLVGVGAGKGDKNRLRDKKEGPIEAEEG